MSDLKFSRYGTFANSLATDGDTGEYMLCIYLGTKNEDEAEKIADEISEVWNQDTDREVKN